MAANLTRTLEMAADAARQGVGLLVFPELFMHRRPDSGAGPMGEIAEPLDGPFMQAVAGAARANRLHLVMGVLERVPGETRRAHNTAVLLSPDGERLAVYRKVHLYDAFDGRESEWIKPGDEPPPVVETPLGRIGLQICYDLRFPEWSRLLALGGAEVIVMPTSWVSGPLKEDHWITLVRARALENTCWFVAADQVRPDRVGRSLVVDPMGVVVAEGGEEEGLVVAEVDLDRVGRVRGKNPSLAHRRPDLYSALAASSQPVSALEEGAKLMP
ncbi:MAG: carbon-nitrogen hydrolase family protein [Armatimonadetes bacterium]|nr:carbon-nitrogen hydrolase family protein [Armatimonadota bacterium]